MTVRVGVVQFPGSNCELDVLEAVRMLGGSAEVVWHKDTALRGIDALIIPGGFAHGDYLRPGALAQFSPIMESVAQFAAEGGPIVGICNGFQVLTEVGLLPGALCQNEGLKFLCRTEWVRVETSSSAITQNIEPGTELAIPINHFSGNYVASPDTLAELADEGRIVLRYVDNPNGSADDIAAICSQEGNVVGLMPHPERAIDVLLGSADGIPLLSSLLQVAGP